MQAQGRWSDAEHTLNTAAQLAPRFAPILEARAQLLRARAVAEKRRPDAAAEIQLYQRALELEDDLSERADLNRTLRELYADNVMYKEALAVADEYIAHAPTPSTYLRDRKDEAAAFAAELRSSIGYMENDFFRELVSRKPQHMGHRAQAVWAHWETENETVARELLQETEPLMRATGQIPSHIRVLRALLLPPDSATNAWIAQMVNNGGRTLAHNERVRLAVKLVHDGRADDGLRLLSDDTLTALPRQLADYAYVRGIAHSAARREDAAMRMLAEAIRHNPYHTTARLSLVTKLRDAGRIDEARRVGIHEVRDHAYGQLYFREVRALLDER